jgi:hypothetical protein
VEIKVEKQSLQGQVVETDESLLTEADAAKFLNINVRHLRYLRLTGRAPMHVRVGLRQVRYTRKALRQWVEENETW